MSIDCGCDVGDGKYVILCMVVVFFVIIILFGIFGGYGCSIDVLLILCDGIGMY